MLKNKLQIAELDSVTIFAERRMVKPCAFRVIGHINFWALAQIASALLEEAHALVDLLLCALVQIASLLPARAAGGE